MTNKNIIKTASEKYVKLTQIEHVLLRPDTYIGSVLTEPKQMFVVNNITDFQDLKVVYKEINYNPGFLKIFDEVITNASDYSIKTNKVTYIKVNITDDYISVENDGPGIPNVIHDTEKIYIGEMIFGHLLTSDNYNDTEDRYSAGRNGLGVKLCNIYSKKFILETADGNKEYYQEFKDNLSTISKPKIKKSKKNYVKVTYYPDFERFGLTNITDDLKSILIKRVLDIAAYNPNVRVSLNGRVTPVRSFRDYMKLFADDSNIYYEKIDEFWEIGVAQSPSDSFAHVSMVNGIATVVGGTHVNFVSAMIVNSIKDILTKTNKDVNIKPIDIRNRVMVFISCKLVNPVFDTQTKENLTSRLNGTSKNVKFNDALLKRLAKAEMFSDIIELSRMKGEIEAHKELNKGVTKRIRVEKLVDANKAGSMESEKCHIFLTEGDSAASLAISGFAVTGRDYYGVYPLRGKPLNVRDIPISKIKDNDEIKNLIQILGLEFGKKYKNLKSLRYGKVVIMSDADCVDGETLVKTLDGNKKIKDLNYIDKVLTHNNEYKSILNIIETNKNKYVEITINGELIKFGEYHKIPVFRDDKVEIIFAKDILITDRLLIKN